MSNNDIKIYVQHAGEEWIVDRIAEEYMDETSFKVVYSPEEADIIWLMAPYAWYRIRVETLKEKFVIATQHHIVPEKFIGPDFLNRDRDAHIDVYFTHDPFALRVLEKLLPEKRTILQNYWCQPHFWKKWDAEKTMGYIENSEKLKSLVPVLKEEDTMVFGSFVRDTEGKTGGPKLEKGPDRLVAIMKTLKAQGEDVHVVLAGYRRDWIISQFEKEGIPYSYFEKCNPNDLLALYNAIDMYLVTSRYEGGPQSIFEAALIQKPILTTRCGSGPRILHPFSICQDEEEMVNRLYSLEQKDIALMMKKNFESVLGFEYKKMIKSYDEMIRELYTTWLVHKSA